MTFPPELQAQVVVGHDGSSLGRATTIWAADWAHQAGAGLLVVRAIGAHEPKAAENGHVELVRDVASVAATHPDLSVAVHVAQGNAAATLVEASRRASCVVVGAAGGHESRSAKLGATADMTASHARCPVIVVPPRTGAPGHRRDVVVGVDGSPEAWDAVAFAAEQSASWSGELTAVHARYAPVTECLGESGLVSAAVDELYRDGGAALWSPVREAHGSAQVRTPLRLHLLDGDPASVLAAAARDAGMLVVADRGTGGFAGLRVGSVTRNLLHDLPCPVAVVRAGAPHPSTAFPPDVALAGS